MYHYLRSTAADRTRRCRSRVAPALLTLALQPRVHARLLALCLASVLGTGVAAEAQVEAHLQGRVLDSTGAAIAGATVTARRGVGLAVASATTDAAGRFTLAVTGGGRVTLVVNSPGFAQSEVEITARPGGQQSLEVVLQAGGLTEELTVVAERLVASEEMRRRVAGSYDVVDSETLQASHVFTTNEALRKVAGVTARDEEGLGLRPNIGLRGLNPTRSTKVLLLEDGLPVSYAPYGDNSSYYHPPIERFDRIEVLKGSSQIAHGPVTLGGVINYITPSAPVRRSASVDLMGGNRSYAHLGASFGNTWGRSGLFTHAQRKSSDGSRENLHSDLADIMVKGSRTFGLTQQLSVKGNYYGEDSQVTYSGLRQAEFEANPRQNPFVNDVFDGRRWGVSTAYRALVASRLALTASAYTSGFNRDWWRQSSSSGQRPNDAGDPLCGGMANLGTTCGNEGRLRDYRQTGAELRARVDGTLGLRYETDFGVRAHTERQDRLQKNGPTPTARDGVLVEDNLRTTDAVAAFIQQRWLAGRWTFTPGLRLERVNYGRTNRLQAVSGETDLTEWLPGVGLAYGVSADTQLFAGVHRGFAPPRAEDIINNNTGGVVDLDPERSWNVEIGGRARLGAARLDLTAFSLDYQNQIVPASVAGGVGAALTNGGEALQQGVEAGLNADWRSLRGTSHGVYARVAWTWLPVAKFTGRRTSGVTGFGQVSVSGNRLPYAPETLASITLGYRHARGLDLQFDAQRVGDQFGDDLNTIAGTADGQRGLLPAYTYLNASATWQLPGLPGSLFVTVKNLSDRVFIVDRARGILPGHPRLFQVGTSWRF